MTGELLDELGLTAFLKTTGSRGYHVVVPLRPDRDFDAVRAFARAVASDLVDRAPDLLTVEQRKAKRGNRVLRRHLRNGYGQTAVPPYAVRARPGAPVSTPITWDELSRVGPAQYDIRSVLRRLPQPWAARGPTYAGARRGWRRRGRSWADSWRSISTCVPRTRH